MGKSGKIRTFEDLDVWQMGRDLTLKIYEFTSHFPKEEVYGMTSQTKRAALSVPANVAEGFGRFHFMDKAKFYLNARGSLYELKSHLLVAKDLGFMRDDMSDSIFQEIDKLSLKLNNLINKTRRMKEER
jgi:four helix bundle protein